MESSGIQIGLIIIGLFTVIYSSDVSMELSSDGTQLSQHDQGDIYDAVGAFLGRLYSPSTDKRGIPQCAVASRCTMRVGARFGKLCECGRGYTCNPFLLKCI